MPSAPLVQPARATSRKIYASRFAVEAVTGHGSMGAVYRAIDLATNEIVALKVLFDGKDSPNADLVDRFDQEALLLSELKHPAIVRYIDHGVTPEGERYLAMEWLEGETLEDRLQRGALTMIEAVALGRRIVEALALAHRKGVVHRDIKPANLFLPDGDLERVKVLDFGIARRLFDGRRLTAAGSTLGTPMYMSPEQARGQTDVDARSDLFSLGCVLFECLSGQPPFIGETPMAVLAKICLDESVNIAARCPGLPQAIEGLLGRLLAKARDARPADTTVLAAEMAGMAEQLMALGHEVPAPPRARVATPQITEREQRVFSAIMVSRPPGPSRDLLDGWGVTDVREIDRFKRAIDAFGGQLERFYDGSLVIAITGGGTPTDQSVRAARCALAVKQILPAASLAISTSRTQTRGPLPVGGVLEGTALMLAGEKSGRVRMDEATATLLAARFEMAAEQDSRYLLFEKGLREPPRTVLGREVPCVGRDRELGTLEGFWEEAINEPIARAVLVTGAAGGGKSRVRHEFLERVARRGQSFELLISSGDSMRMGGPYAMIGAALRGAANITGFEPLEVQRKRLAKHVTRRLPEKHATRVASFLGEVTGIHFPDDDYPPLAAARHDPRVMADQTLAAWLDYIEAEVAHQPVLLVMEDLHWGDTPSVRLVDAALRVLRERPLLVAAFARPEIDDRFSGLWDDHGLQRMHLAPLTSKACQKIARAVLGDIGEERAAWITDRADGNPFFLEELLRASAEAGDTNAAQRLVEALPTTVLGVVQARFDALGNDGKRVLRAASIYGKTFRRSALVPLLGDKAAHDLDTWLDVLAGRDIVIASDVVGTREFVFRHALLREAAYDTVTEGDRTLGHRLAGEWLEKAGEQDAMVLADHFERAGIREKAAKWCQVGAEQALEANDLPAVLVRVERGIANGATGEVLARMQVAAAEAHFHLGNAEAGMEAARAAAESRDSSTRFAAIATLAQCLATRDDRGELDMWRARIEGANVTPSNRRSWQLCMLRLVDALTVRGRDLDSVECLLQTIGDDTVVRDPLLVALRAELMSRIQSWRGDVGFSLSRVEEAARAYEAGGDQRALCRLLNSRGIAQLDAGLLDLAKASFEAAQRIASRHELRLLAPYLVVNLSLVALERGDHGEALELAKEAIATGAHQGDTRVEGYGWYLTARALCACRDFEGAERASLASAGLLRTVETLMPAIRAAQARAVLGQGRISEALALAETAAHDVLRMGAVQDGESLVLLVYAECLWAAELPDRARDAVAAATRRLRERSAGLENEAARRAFVTNLPEHRRTLEMYDRLCSK